ncbi:sugar MFS transporter [Prolixibacteraceae bacterium Z1-6]|uniref:Sugar MFS transporter n=1 Tax=Draconibacterium aestuarii TaxID=2998507 RepID=A0A9X3J932_9BACT|nr:sugar MFS transporter [Prolixibacteraceae bacterium Z1-6]
MKKNYLIVVLILFIFFVISFLTNIIGPLIPEVIKGFSVSKGMAGLLNFSFFIAYGVMSIPAGILTEKYKEKKVILGAFVLATLGALLFSVFSSFPVYLISLFLIGLGMAILQVAINPLLRVSGGEEHFAFTSVLAQLFFGGASFLSPLLYSYLVTNLSAGNTSNALLATLDSLVPENLKWVSIYWIFVFVALVMIIIVMLSKLPKVELKEDEKVGSLGTIKELLKNKYVILFFFGIFAYVGTEQGVASWISKFLADYHGMNPEVEGAKAISWFWGLLTIGCFLGLGLLKLLDSKIVLRIFSVAAMVSLAIALTTGNGMIAFYGFIGVGFFASVMWSVIFSLALNSLKDNHGAFSGILCSGIIGGAIVPLIVGVLGDAIGLRAGMMFVFITLGYILSISFWAKPLIKNKTIFTRD